MLQRVLGALMSPPVTNYDFLLAPSVAIILVSVATFAILWPRSR